MTDTPSTAGVISLEDHLLSQLQSRCLRDTLHTLGATRDGYQALSVPSAVFTNEMALKHSQTTPDHHTHINRGYNTSEGAERGEASDHPSAASHPQDDEDRPVGAEEGEDTFHECSGYMADTEYNSPKLRRKNKRKLSVLDDPEEDGGGDGPGGGSNSPAHCPYPLPMRDNSLGLYRIRQGRVLRKVLKVTYLCTLFAFICCVLQLYAMFGVYGVLSNETTAQPWPWYVFMTCSR